jgi:hypothetical protein
MKTKDEVLAGIANEICDGMGLVPVAVLSRGNKNQRAIKARRAIASALYDAGFGTNDIASLFNISPGAVGRLRSDRD